MDKMMKLIPAEKLDILKEVMQSEDPAKMMKPGMNAKQMFAAIDSRGAANIELVNKSWQLKEGDVIVSSYPKTGTNWTAEIIDRLMFQDLEEFEKWKSLPLTLRMFEMGNPKKFDIIDSLSFERRVHGTHVRADRLDMDRIKKSKAKVVYVLRNPKDTLVSMFNFLKKLPPFQMEPMKSMVNSGFTVFFNHYMNGEIPIDGSSEGNYLTHIQGWLKSRDDMGMYFIYYEDLKKDFAGEVRKLAKYLEVPLSDEKLQEISEKCTIDSMKKSYTERAGFQGKHATAFINKGGVGGWKNYFTVEQSEIWDELVKKEMAGTDIKFQYTI